jgi:hypothetical protein
VMRDWHPEISVAEDVEPTSGDPGAPMCCDYRVVRLPTGWSHNQRPVARRGAPPPPGLVIATLN